jgi:hypothetical protein
VAAVLGGAPISTFELDIVHQRQPDNVARLLAAPTRPAMQHVTDRRRWNDAGAGACRVRHDLARGPLDNDGDREIW